MVHLNKSINYTIQSVTEVQQKVVMEVLHTTLFFLAVGLGLDIF